MTTMRDVALRAGVSVPTVSYVVNDGPRPVSAKTREKVLKAIEELGYKPNQMAKSLARRSTRAIALIVPNNSDLFFARLARAVEEVAYSEGFNLFLCNTSHNLEREMSTIASLLEKKIDGILLITSGMNANQVRQAVGESLPLVILDREIEGVFVDTVVFNNKAAGKKATEHLLQHGHTNIACLAGPKILVGAVHRVDGYKEALRDARIAPVDDLICWSDYTFEGGLNSTLEILSKEKRPSAIVACNDEMGVSVIHAARQLKLEVPQDLAVVGVGDSFVGQVSIPRLTTIFASVDEMGRMGADILFERVKGTRPLMHSLNVLGTKLVIRESCGCNAEA